MGGRLVIDGVSALRFWRWYRTVCPALPVWPSRIRMLGECVRAREEIDDALRRFVCSSPVASSRVFDNRDPRLEAAKIFGDRLHILVPKKSDRPRVPDVVSRVMGSDPIAGSLTQIADDVFVLSPAATFAQVARDLTVPRRVLLGMELCGSYAPSPLTGEHSFEIAPLACVKDLTAYCESLPHSPGSKAHELLSALRWVVDGSASLMESVVVVLLVLPYKRGGYAIDVPLMNIGLDSAGNVVPPRTKGCVMPDIVWLTSRLALEYNGKGSHSTQDHYEHDSDRKERLELLGYRVIPISSKRLLDVAQFHEVALEVARRTGKRLCLPALFDANRSALRADVLPPRRRGPSRPQGGRSLLAGGHGSSQSAPARILPTGHDVIAHRREGLPAW